jgi:hypothetical protein
MEVNKEFEWRPFQKSIMEMCKRGYDKNIHIIVDEWQGIGKTLLCNYLYKHNIANYIIPEDDRERLLSNLYYLRVLKSYIFEIPNNIVIDIETFLESVESLKDGYLINRKNYKIKHIERANVIIFTNKIPKVTYKPYKFIIWRIDEKYKLEKIDSDNLHKIA